MPEIGWHLFSKAPHALSDLGYHLNAPNRACSFETLEPSVARNRRRWGLVLSPNPPAFGPEIWFLPFH